MDAEKEEAPNGNISNVLSRSASKMKIS